MPRFKITSWTLRVKVIEAASLEEAVSKADQVFKKWESVQYIKPEQARRDKELQAA